LTRIGPEAARRTCGCKAAPAPSPAPVATVKPRRVPLLQAVRERAAMCNACNGGQVCPEGGPAMPRVIRNDCPRGLFPDDRGRVRWRRWLWSGVPMHIRVRLFLTTDADPETWFASFTGCGCNRTWKAAWLRLVRKWRW